MLDSLFTYSFDTSHKGKICPKCKRDINTIRQNGRLGCSRCYVTFKEDLLYAIKNYHGHVQHVGKFPSNYKGSNEGKLKSLNEKLKEAINKEDYSEAARIRDLINEIKGDING